jgi:hypothetical protein
MTVVVVMTQHIPDPGDRFPLDAFLFGFEALGKPTARFRDDFEIALDKLLGSPVGSKAVEVMTGDIGLDIGDRFEKMVGIAVCRI